MPVVAQTFVVSLCRLQGTVLSTVCKSNPRAVGIPGGLLTEKPLSRDGGAQLTLMPCHSTIQRMILNEVKYILNLFIYKSFVKMHIHIAFSSLTLCCVYSSFRSKNSSSEIKCISENWSLRA